MRYPSTSTFLLTTSAVLILSAPVPLNINMGAYSPALVVGDGAIGFKDGATSVENLMNTLQGAAASTAAANGAAAPAVAQDQAEASLLKNVVTTEKRDTADDIEGEGWESEKRDEAFADEGLQVDEEAVVDLEERDLAGFNGEASIRR